MSLALGDERLLAHRQALQGTLQLSAFPLFIRLYLSLSETTVAR